MQLFEFQWTFTYRIQSAKICGFLILLKLFQLHNSLSVRMLLVEQHEWTTQCHVQFSFSKGNTKVYPVSTFQRKASKKCPKTVFCPNSTVVARVRNLTQFSWGDKKKNNYSSLQTYGANYAKFQPRSHTKYWLALCPPGTTCQLEQDAVQLFSFLWWATMCQEFGVRAKSCSMPFFSCISSNSKQ